MQRNGYNPSRRSDRNTYRVEVDPQPALTSTKSKTLADVRAEAKTNRVTLPEVEVKSWMPDEMKNLLGQYHEQRQAALKASEAVEKIDVDDTECSGSALQRRVSKKQALQLDLLQEICRAGQSLSDVSKMADKPLLERQREIYEHRQAEAARLRDALVELGLSSGFAGREVHRMPFEVLSECDRETSGCESWRMVFRDYGHAGRRQRDRARVELQRLKQAILGG